MTLQSRIFRKLFLSAVLLIAVTLVGLDFYLTRYTARREVEIVRRQLGTNARLLAGELPQGPRRRLEDWAKVGGGRARARVTFISPDGVVFADSEHDPETMENHAARPEVREAASQGTGSSIRHSATLNRDLYYLAISLPYEGQPGYILRLAVPLEDLEGSVRAVRRRILAASLVAAVLALGIAYYFSRSLTHRIERLRAFAQDLLSASARADLAVESSDELGSLAQSLNRTAQQLRELVDRLNLESARREAILSSMVEGVLAVNAEIRVIFCNESFLRAVGRSAPVNEGAPLVELIRDPEPLDFISQVLTSGEPARRRVQLASAAGRVFELQAAPLAASSRRGAVVILHDITELERLERVRKDFVANVSHELRTPLTAIQGYAETLLEGALEDPENNRKFLEIIKAHAIRLNHIASDLLTLSALESGKPAGESERISVRVALEAALRTVESEARIHNVKVLRKKQEDAEVEGDRLRLEQVFINLLDNAIKFNRPGGEVQVESARTPDGKIRITVADTGIGIASEHLPRIFERFYRVDKARSRELGGTGLGLSIVKHVVERMRGSVSVESRLGKGSTFAVSLPIERVTMAQGSES